MVTLYGLQLLPLGHSGALDDARFEVEAGQVVGRDRLFEPGHAVGLGHRAAQPDGLLGRVAPVGVNIEFGVADQPTGQRQKTSAVGEGCKKAMRALTASELANPKAAWGFRLAPSKDWGHPAAVATPEPLP